MMQLPRGTFHSMKKGNKIGLILKSLKDDVFTGSCSLACEGYLIDLIVRDGNILLASCNSSCGNPAMDIIATLHDHVADASLSNLTQAQMKLTLEFNTQCKVNPKRGTPPRPLISSPEEKKSMQSGRLPKIGAEGPVIEDMHITALPSASPDTRSQPRKTTAAVPNTNSHPGKTTASPPAPEKSKSADIFAREGEESAIVDRDLNALDSMDLNTMSDKIRENCKLMVEKLHLDHLMENPRD